MKIIITLLMLLVAGSGTAFAQKKDKKETVLLNVSMDCEKCKKKIERNIAYEKGVNDMKVDLPAKTVFIEFNNTKTSVEKLQKAFKTLGYEATPVVADEKETTNEK